MVADDGGSGTVERSFWPHGRRFGSGVEVESRRGAVAWAIRHRPGFPPGSSKRTCGFPTFGSARGTVKTSFPTSPPLLLLARRPSSDQVAGTTALPPKADLRAASSALPPNSSASPPGADLPGDAPVRLALTRSGHYRLSISQLSESEHRCSLNDQACATRTDWRTIRQRVFPSDARAQWPADDDPAATDGLAADDVKTARHHQQNTENRGRSR